MKNVIVAWVNHDAESFEETYPLKFLGERNNTLGFSNKINVLFLSGFNLLSDEYKNSLIESGYKLHDVNLIYSEFSEKYDILGLFGDDEKKRFLRWPVINKYFCGERIVHYDGDIVFNEDPEAIKDKVGALTFVLKGCPAFTVINDPEWFSQYEEQLKLFTDNIDDYSEKAWESYKKYEVINDPKWAGMRYRRIISSDQEFLSHLVCSDLIHQSKPDDIMKNLGEYILFDNPLWPSQINHEIPFTYKRIDGVDYFNDKKILLWHMQSGFTFYLARFIFRQKFLKPFASQRLPIDINGKGIEAFFNKKLNKFTKHLSRLNVYNYYLRANNFSGVFKSNIWWKQTTFK